MPHHIIEQTLDNITVHNLKHISDLEIDFSGNRVTGVFGMIGCGKSSILHALACFYRPLNNGSERNYFTRFFLYLLTRFAIKKATQITVRPFLNN